MFYLDGVPILADEMNVIQKLKSDMLDVFQVEYLKDIKKGPKNINITCPFHKNGQEKRPSCGITIEHPQNKKSGLVHCFTCGYSSDLPQFISDCFGYQDFGKYGTQWLAKNFLQVTVEERTELDLNFNREEKSDLIEYVSEEELEGYRYIHPYAYQRKMTDDVIEKFDVGYDIETDCLTFPVRDKEGNVLFVARRSVRSKFFNYPMNAKKPVYGLYELDEDISEIIVCEGVIDALTCYVYGRPAVALLGVGTEFQYEQLSKLSCRKIICGFDGDKAGRRAALNLADKLSDRFLITSFDMPEGKDINDLTEEEFNSLEEYFVLAK